MVSESCCNCLCVESFMNPLQLLPLFLSIVVAEIAVDSSVDNALSRDFPFGLFCDFSVFLTTQPRQAFRQAFRQAKPESNLPFCLMSVAANNSRNGRNFV